MTNQFYDVLLPRMVFIMILKSIKQILIMHPLIDENTGEWIEIPDISELLLKIRNYEKINLYTGFVTVCVLL